MTTGLLNAIEAAEHLTCSVKTLRRIVKRGKIVVTIVSLGAKRPRYGFALADLEAYKRENRKRFIPPPEKPCRPTNRKTPLIITTPSTGKVIGFTALRAAQIAARQKPLSAERSSGPSKT